MCTAREFRCGLAYRASMCAMTMPSMVSNDAAVWLQALLCVCARTHRSFCSCVRSVWGIAEGACVFTWGEGGCVHSTEGGTDVHST